VVDDEIAFVGGIEPTTAGGDRFDGQHHRPRGKRGWHDATTLLRGPVVADVAEHFCMRWREVTGEELASPRRPEPAGEVTAQIVRTVPEKVYKSLPHGDFSILESYTRALRSARRLIYFENQFLWSPHIVDLLADKLRDPPGDDFRIVLLLPSRPTTGMDDTLGQLGILLDADRSGRLLACSLYAHSEGEVEQIYVHAKVGIVDDEWLTVGSANLNNHSLFNDTEMNVVTCDRDLARNTRLRLWAEHLERDVSGVEADATRLIDEVWRPTAEEQLRRREKGQPLTHRLVRLPHASKRAKRLLGPIQGLMVDG
jgi:phosphatidylserine/phosphatidylglycerophosphate/cardiolipin synthase-like enzyme